MIKKLPQGVKISITRSIQQAFEQYMAKIHWNEDEYDLNEFAKEWKTYIQTQASWYDKIDEDIKTNATFHEELAQKINATIKKTLTEAPTKEQIDEIETMQKELGTSMEYSCKAEAKYVQEELARKKKTVH
ncbi:hypothetical protein [Bacillus fonticola]|uniref:hypothetical protein n=1 Tax=Bacillus fonticola TaxID=2728853 RepID=UPI001473F696|nr:hypothetical protein [Bacillus fonticola]